jgi:tetratricopeptide (TPR) repeat protein
MLRHASILLLFLSPMFALGAEDPSDSPAMESWRKGQVAMLEGRTEQAIASYQQSLQQDPTLARNHLSLAAAYLSLGQDESAAGQLKCYLRAQPDHCIVRGQYAELLWRLNRLESSREQFERFESDIQEHEQLALEHLSRCHGRLLDIARTEEDEYAMHLHRGIGLYWLARRRAALADPEGELSCQGLLCESASELMAARRQRPDEARPCWYLYEVWSRLGQNQPAQRWLRAAESAADFSYLTPTERCQLHFTCRSRNKTESRP